jgi:hypothetical protein
MDCMSAICHYQFHCLRSRSGQHFQEALGISGLIDPQGVVAELTPEACLPLSPLSSGDAHDPGGAEGREAVHECDADLDFSSLAVTVPISSPSGIWSNRSGRTGLSPSLLGVNSTARMSEVAVSMAR